MPRFGWALGSLAAREYDSGLTREGLIRFSDPIVAILYSLFLFLDSSMAIPCSFISPLLRIQIQFRLPFHPHEKVPTAGQPDRPRSPRYPRRAPGSPHGCLHPRILGVTGRSAHCCSDDGARLSGPRPRPKEAVLDSDHCAEWSLWLPTPIAFWTSQTGLGHHLSQVLSLAYHEGKSSPIWGHNYGSRTR